MKLKVVKLHDDVVKPSYGSVYAAGLDICSYGEHIVHAGTRTSIPTGLCIEWINDTYDEQLNPHNYYLRIAPRSGLSIKHNIDIGAGVIDYDYRGEIKICFINNSDKDYHIKHGDRIAQGILEQISHFSSIDIVDHLDETERNINGFGSTGY